MKIFFLEMHAKVILGSVLICIKVWAFFLNACSHASPNYSTCIEILVSSIQMAPFAYFNSTDFRSYQ